ncbi:very-long-chain 3-oxoacyl-CoA reductase-B-like [Acanthaster planci]|uniref:Very-long-chain 3-oxoacyl-CoA reductase-B-like n=1 Tax=Acanthaster planci TaxID=133434 RepID=A0A8B7YQT5_ACAPL|nr:very-long-chain 3-oxoacyl-CoA reductase-B-like [Acanthaster planci]
MPELTPFGALNPALATLGAVVAFCATFRLVSSLVKALKSFFLAGPLGLSTNVQKYGEWAAVTGATDGIGKAYVEQLAAKGLNIVLLSRSPDKLNDVAAEVESRYKVKTKAVAVDFSGGAEIYSKIAKEILGLNVGVLVNNVGVSYPFPQYFHELPDQQKFLADMLNLNCLSVTMMISIVLPGMLERKKGIVINLSSASGMNPSPLLSVYSSSKAYVDFLTRSLQTEYGSRGIIFQSVLPFYVTTKLSKIRRSSMTVPTPTGFVRSALATLGLEDRTNGCLSHSLQGWFVEAVPTWLLDKIQMSMHLGIRKTALKRLEQKKAN